MRRILPILAFLFLIALQSQGQASRTLPVDGGLDKIVKLYPNPATTFITFDLASAKKGLTVHIYNGVLGKKMFESSNIPQKLTVNLNGFTRGVYIYHLIDNNGRIIESGKFQVSN